MTGYRGSGPDPGLWDFSLALYARPGVAEACLALQERHGIDVNLLLFCCWSGDRGHRLAPRELADLVAAVDAWHAEVVRPLRGVRRWLKGRDLGLGEPVEALRAEIKARELDAERIEQRLLEGTLAIAAGEPSPTAAAANLRAYLEAIGADDDDARDADDVAVLLRAAFPELAAERPHTGT